MRNKPPARLAVVAFLLTMVSCSLDFESNVESGTRDQVLHVGNGTEPQELDPHVVTGVSEHHLIIALNEGLVSRDPVDLSIQPAVADRWQISADMKTYTFTLRADARWSNGQPLTAQDFVDSWRRALSPGLAYAYAYNLYALKNAERFNLGEITDFTQVGARAVDDRTLLVELERPVPYFLQLLDHYSYFPVPLDIIRQYGPADARGTAWTRPGRHVGNGAYVLTEWQMNRVIIVKKNPHYWDRERVAIQEIRFYPIDNQTTEEHMFRANQLHITSTVPLERLPTYRKKTHTPLRINPYLGTYYYALNTRIPVLEDKRIRRALGMSIDRRSIVAQITRGGQLPAYNFTPPDTNGYTAEATMPYDITAAKELLVEAGYPDGAGFPPLTILYNTSDAHRKIAIAIQAMWKQALNIEVTLENQEWKVYLDTTDSGDYDIARAAWIGDYLDPNTFLDMFTSENGNNRTGWSNTDYDALIKAAANTVEQQQRFAYFQQAEAILMQEAPIIPIYTYTRQMLIHADVKGYAANIMDHRSYKHMVLERTPGRN